MGDIMAFKELSIKEIMQLNESDKLEYQLEALDYYGNLTGQLDGFEKKEKIHGLLLTMSKLNPISIYKLNEIRWPDDNKNCIFSANHSNANDFLTLGQLIKKHFFIMADFTMINDPIVDKINRLNGCIYLDRMSRISGKNALQQAIDGVYQGYNMAIFPESTWNLFEDKLMLPRKWGDIIVAQQTKRPIVPVAMVYNYKNCFVKFGDPFYVNQNDNIKHASDELAKIMEQLRKDIINSEKYRILYRDIPYEKWLVNTIKSYKNFDVEYEMSVIRNDSTIDENELNKIIEIGEKVHPVEEIEMRLKNSKVNYRIKR